MAGESIVMSIMRAIRGRRQPTVTQERVVSLEEVPSEVYEQLMRHRDVFESRSVFISYRRKLSESLARLVRDDLNRHRFDTFVDLENLDNGEFEPVILRQIEARKHFIVLLEPGSLDQIGQDGDWLRREIAHALARGRNVVPVTTKGFEFRRDPVLPPDVAKLKSLNGIAIPSAYFEEAMERLRTRFLKTPSNP